MLSRGRSRSPGSSQGTPSSTPKDGSFHSLLSAQLAPISTGKATTPASTTYRSSKFHHDRPLVKGPLYVRYEDRWTLCQVELSSSKLKIEVHPGLLFELSEHRENSQTTLLLAPPEEVNFCQIVGAQPTTTKQLQRSLSTMPGGFSAPGAVPLKPSLSRQGSFPELLGASVTSLQDAQSVPMEQHPLCRSVEVDRLREVKILHFLHYFDRFTFEVVCKRSNKFRNKFSNLALPAHFSQSVNESLGDCQGDRYEVLTFKAVDQGSLFEWVDAFEDAADPIEHLMRNIVQATPSDWRFELPVFGQVQSPWYSPKQQEQTEETKCQGGSASKSMSSSSLAGLTSMGGGETPSVPNL